MGGEYYYIIVYARNELEALNIGNELFKKLVIKFGSYASYSTWDEDPSDEELSVLNLLNTEAKELIDYLMDKMWKDFKRDITNVREMIEKYNDEEIFEEWAGSPSHRPNRYRFHVIGQQIGPWVYLYDNAGEGIVNRRHLKRVLDKYSSLYQDKENPYKDLDIFIVPALIRS